MSSFSVWAVIEILDFENEPGTWLLRTLFHDGPRHFKYSVDLTVEGKPLKISRVIECRPLLISDLVSGWFRSRFYVVPKAMTHRLDSGSCIIVVVPRDCRVLAVNLPPEYIPLIAWVDNAERQLKSKSISAEMLWNSLTQECNFTGWKCK